MDLCSLKMGTMAADLLLKQIRGTKKMPPQHVVLEETLVVRGTTSSPHRKQK
jgi:DNA-binding LacI/PurR family transcriptional regulator